MEDLTWMTASANTWTNNNEFKHFDRLVKGIICVNDVAERNVQNMTRYAKCVCSKRLDTVVKVANEHRMEHNLINATQEDLNKL